MSIVPAGSKLTTYDPDKPQWASNTAQQDSDLWRNYLGFLLEKPGNKANKRLVVITGGDDPQEQSAHKTLRFLVRELLSGSLLARRLIHKFSFLIVPLGPLQGVRDGFSRFSFDCIPPGEEGNMLAGGGSEVAEALIARAVYNWVYDPTNPHPLPAQAGFCVGQFHCDNLNHSITDKKPTDVALQTAHYGVPVSPYGALVFPGHEADDDSGLSYFVGDADVGFTSAIWPEFMRPNNITAGDGAGANYLASYGGTSWYFELPWRHSGHKASFWGGDDIFENFALGFLAGLAQAVGAAIPLEDISVQSGAAVAMSACKQLVANVAVQAGATVALTVEMTRIWSLPIQSAAQVATAIKRTACLPTLAIQSGATVAIGSKKLALQAAAACTSTATVDEATATRSWVQIPAVACTSAATVGLAVVEQGRRRGALACTSAATLSAASVSRTSANVAARACTSAATTSTATYSTARSRSASACTSAATLSLAGYESAANPNIRNASAQACSSAATVTSTGVSRGVRVSAQACTAIATAICTTGDSNSAFYNRFILGRRR